MPAWEPLGFAELCIALLHFFLFAVLGDSIDDLLKAILVEAYVCGWFGLSCLQVGLRHLSYVYEEICLALKEHFTYTFYGVIRV